MTSVIRKPLRRLVPIIRNNYLCSLNLERSHHYVQKEVKTMKLSKMKHSIPILCSNLSRSKSSDTGENNPKSEQHKDMMDDPEIQSILSDFAKDFEVGSDSEQILDDIRKSLDEEYNQASSVDKGSCSEYKSKKSSSQDSKELTNSLKEKFKEFSDIDSTVIPSYEEVVSNKEDYVYHISQETEAEDFSPEIAKKRGIRGVFDIEEIIEVLRKEKLDGITAISVPKELHYCDYLVIVTAISPRHCDAVCERVKKLFKLKKNAEDPFVFVEGERASEWRVLDMGNIVLHVFLEETRRLYNIESLWLFDLAFDRGGNMKDDPMYTAIEQQMSFFNSINANLSENPKPEIA